MLSPWLLAGELVVHADGKPILCELCPCGAGAPCDCCEGFTPLKRSIAVTGVTGAGCGDFFNAAHELLQGYVLSSGIGGPCAWGKHDVPTTYRIEEEVFCYGGDVYIQGYLESLSGWGTFEKVIAGDAGDCSAGWGELNVTANAAGDCDFSASTFTDTGPT